MTHARQEDAWNHTSALMAMVANVHRYSKEQKMLSADELHPMRTQEKDIVIHDTKLAFEMMRKVFCKREGQT